MAQGEVIVRFENVSFEYGHNKPILDDVSFTVRRGAKLTLMGQNGAGKSSLFALITGSNKPEDGDIHIGKGVSIAISKQVVPRDQLELTVREFFEKCFPRKIYNLDPKIDECLGGGYTYNIIDNLVIEHSYMKKFLLAILFLSAFPSITMAQTTTCIDLKNNMLRGAKNANTNNEVIVLQKFLKAKGFLTSTPNGSFGPATLSAVKKFQSSVGIGSQGTPGYGGIGPKSRAKIKEMTCGGATTATPGTTTISVSIPVQAPVATAATTSVVSPATTQAVIPMSTNTESSWVIVFTHRGTPFPNEIIDFICGTVKSNVVSWVEREFMKNQITKPFDNIVCLTDQILLSEKQLSGGEKITGEGVTFTNPINDNETSKFLENKIPTLIKAKYITVLHYLVPTNLQFANHALSPTPKYDTEFITSFNLPDGKLTFIPPSTDIDTYSQELTHEFMHKIGATDKYFIGAQACKTDPATGQQYDGYDIMCHRKPWGGVWDGFITPKFSELIISEATAQEIKR